MDTLKPHIAVVILNWNGKKYLQQFLPSVIAHSESEAEIIIADNGSTDDSVSFLKETYPALRVCCLGENYGFAEGYNRALKEIAASYYILLNSDVEVTRGWIQPMLHLMESDDTIAACQPKILSLNQRTMFEYAGAAGGWIDRLGYPFCRGRIFETLETDKGQYDSISEVFWASGAAMMVRADDFLGVGGFDDFFFAHQEEIDWCWRVKNNGKKVYVCPSSIVYHLGGGSLAHDNPRKLFLNYRNNLIMIWKNLSASEKAGTILLRMVLDGVAGIRFLFTGKFRYCFTIAEAHFSFYRWLFIKKRINTANRPLKSHSGVYNGSIVWEYFGRGKKIFSDIVKIKK
ncbi:MAG: glycosyltransferase family 2 protein [Chitinophagaceae bacterium]|nr:glycosyltransferase family 2 protein [Chitinophagaceae bacterium]MCW5913812.1 glycosyltransferase family 2 protein [Chitinophagaceae bacterium]MCZ2398077.1 glycosyltransferase family 2 protein [Chitinophagales bacterium]